MQKRLEEKRSYLRLNVALEAEYTMEGSEKVYTALTKDISAVGIKFARDEKLEEGANLEIKLNLPNVQNPVHASGRVAWTKKIGKEDKAPFDIGVEFTRIEEDNKNTFLKYLCDVLYG